MEGQHLVASRAGAFREDCHALSGVERLLHLLAGAMGGLAAAALDEYGAVMATDPADHGPARNFALGDKR